MATQPEPEKRSRKEHPVRSPRIEKRDSRILSMAGLISPGGQTTCLRTYFPPVIRMGKRYQLKAYEFKACLFMRNMARAARIITK